MYPDSNRSKSKTLSNDEPPQSAGRAGHFIDYSVFKSQKPGITANSKKRVGKKNSRMGLKRGGSKRTGVQESNAQQYNEIVKLVQMAKHDRVIMEQRGDSSEKFDTNETLTELSED